MARDGDCPHCGAGILVAKGGRAKARTSIVVVSSAGVEINCPSCKRPVLIPGSPSLALQKAERPRYIVRG